MKLGETINNTLARLHFRSVGKIPSKRLPDIRPLPEYESPEFPMYLIIESKFGENAEKGQIMSHLEKALKAMREGGIGFWKPNRVPDFDDENLRQGIQGPNADLFAETFEIIKKSIDPWNMPLLDRLDKQDRWDDGKRTMFIPAEVMKEAPASLVELVGLLNIIPYKYGHQWFNIETEGIVGQISYSEKGTVGLQIGVLSEKDPQHSQQLGFFISPSRGASGLSLTFFGSSFTPSPEVFNRLQGFGDEARRAALFNDAAKFLASCLDRPDIIRTPWNHSSHDRRKPKAQNPQE